MEDGQSIKHKKRRLACRVRDCPAEVTLDNQRLYKPMSFIHHNHDDHIELVAKTNNGQTSQRKSTTGHSQLIRLHTTKAYNQTSQRNGMMKSRSASKATPKEYIKNVTSLFRNNFKMYIVSVFLVRSELIIEKANCLSGVFSTVRQIE